jgi:hypothetical protein
MRRLMCSLVPARRRANSRGSLKPRLGENKTLNFNSSRSPIIPHQRSAVHAGADGRAALCGAHSGRFGGPRRCRACCCVWPTDTRLACRCRIQRGVKGRHEAMRLGISLERVHPRRADFGIGSRTADNMNGTSEIPQLADPTLCNAEVGRGGPGRDIRAISPLEAMRTTSIVLPRAMLVFCAFSSKYAYETNEGRE